MKKIAVAILFGLCATPSYAAAPPGGPSQSFSLDSKTLPASFKGTSCRPIAATLREANLSKDEFESVDQFNKRMAVFRSQSRLPGIRPDTYVSFVRSIEPTSAVYDAEVGKLTVTMEDDTLASVLGKVATTGFTTETKVVSERKYSASNSYGATVTVKKTHASTCAIGFLNPPFENSRFPKRYEIEMIPSVAKSAKSRLALLYIGTIEAPYLEDFGMYSKPTIRDPSEFLMSGDTLLLWIAQYWIFDRATGQVYVRENLKAE